MSSLKPHWQDYANPTQLLDYFVCGAAKYAIPLFMSPLMYTTITKPEGMFEIYGLTTLDVGLVMLAGHLGHSFFRAAKKRKFSDIAEADSRSSPWHQAPIIKSSLFKAFIEDVFTLPRLRAEYREQKFAYWYDGQINRLRYEANRLHENDVRLNNGQAPRPK